MMIEMFDIEVVYDILISPGYKKIAQFVGGFLFSNFRLFLENQTFLTGSSPSENWLSIIMRPSAIARIMAAFTNIIISRLDAIIQHFI